MRAIPEGLVVGGPATTRPTVIALPAEAVLRPKLVWQLLLGLIGAQAAVGLISAPASGSWEWPALFFVVPSLLVATGAWRKKVVLRGDELRQQGTFAGYPVLRAAEIAAITAQQEERDGGEDGTRAVVMRVWQANGTYRAYYRFWWDGWEVLARWVAAHHTKESAEGVPHWTIPTEAETMRRLAPLLEATPPA